MKIKRLVQVFCSLFLSFLILNAVCFFYYNVPVHSESESGSTDYVWEKGKFYSKGTEGFAWGRTDEKGFNNLTAENGVRPEILIMGSSHTEAFNVAQNESYSYLLNELVVSSGMDWNTYNIGISGHRITTCFNNFERAVNEFQPSEYVVVEVSTTELTMDEINQISEGTVKKIHSSANPILVFLQKIPFVRCVYYQIDKMGFDVKNTNNIVHKEKNVKAEVNNTTNPDSGNEYNEALNLLMKNLNSVAEKNGVKIIILLNSNLSINKNGEVISPDKNEKEEAFEYACLDNGIGYLDMHSAYSEMYNETHCLPHGFSNTAVGEGHLNKHGHKAVAEALYNYIFEFENRSLA